MSTLEPGDTPGYGTVGGAPQGYPGYAGYPGYPAYPGYGNVTAPGASGVPVRRETRGRVWRIIAMVMFFLAALANALEEFGPDQAWKNPQDAFFTVLFTMACLLTACMLLPAKTRGLGAGLALGQALAESARFINEVTPSSFDQFNLVQKLSFTGSYILTALGGVAVLIALLIERGPTDRATRMPVPVLALGIPASVLWTIGTLQANYAWTFAGSPQSSPCCSWSMSNGVGRTADVLVAVAMLAIVLLAAFVPRPGLAKGLLAGVVVTVLSETVANVMSVVLPTSVVYGIGGGNGQAAVTAQAQSGLWFSLVGLILFVVAFFIQRGEGGPQAVPYAGATAYGTGWNPQWQQQQPPPPQPPGNPFSSPGPPV